MQSLYQEKKARSFYFFLLITAVPIIGVIIIFSFMHIHIRNNIEFVSHELRGLEIVSQIQKSVLDIQKMRGLVCIDCPSKETLGKIETLQDVIVKDMEALQVATIALNGDTPLKKELLAFVYFVNTSKFEYLNFEEFTDIVDSFMSFSNYISYHCKLILEPDLNRYLLVENIVSLFPSLIEYNGQIRAVASSTKKGSIASVQKQHISIQLSKIQDKMQKIEFNLYILQKTLNSPELETTYKNMKKAQKNIEEFAKNELLAADGVSVEPNGIYVQMTQNVDFIVALYDMNRKILKSDLDKELKENSLYLFYISSFGLICVVFVIFINRKFYLKNKKYIDKIEELTVTDAMTALYNRRHFDEVFEKSLKIQQRTGQTLIFIIFDIDFFKQYNDTYGHQAGDVAIKAVAQSAKESLRRAGDMAFRLGGEEFGILCVGMSESEALLFANNIREKIESKKIEHKSSYVSRYLTVSMGVIVVESGMVSSTSEIYKHADDALYLAKESGRNQAVFHDAKAF
ncbi:MAG: GGDEF domain-containing protein [Sulfurimonas sp.]|uniref:GGDEF domain-containing protein n=1 Tax=Sulfurimonas sp. TaxID=2022749 RepID=UPI0026289817|nr:GGDEF domain-containing protein [Sulfurimonas sp.]MDD2652235.1 GGDEF domain-containing protein [Sulfurimonas sp.]MDD3450483.1 GGDEF domain-containing protein [Sulfurimonas sp.]